MAGPYWQAAGPQLTSARGPERRRSSAISNGVEPIEPAKRPHRREGMTGQTCEIKVAGRALMGRGSHRMGGSPFPIAEWSPKSANM
jgi:hypothetical protein